MKKLITVFSILFLFAIASCEKEDVNFVSEQAPTPSLKKLNSEGVDYEDYFNIENGVLVFRNKESFDLISNYVYESLSNRNHLKRYLKGKSFSNLYNYYEGITINDLQEIFDTHRIPNSLSKYFELIPDNDGDLDLEEKVRETFLQLYFNKDLIFKIGEDQIQIINDDLFLSKADGQKLPLQATKKSNQSKLRSIKASSNSVTWDHGGRKFKLKIDTDTRWGSVTLYVNGSGNLNF